MSTYMLCGLPGEHEFEAWVAYCQDPRDGKRYYATVNADRFFNRERSASMAVTRCCNAMISEKWRRAEAVDLYGRTLERKDFIIERVRITLEVVRE